MFHQKVIDLKQDEFLYKKGDSGSGFYFVVDGQIEVLVKPHAQPDEDDTEFKFSKSVDPSTYFGQKTDPTEPRNDYARIKSEKCQVIEFDVKIYRQIVQNTQLSVQEKKIEFLTRFVPNMRSLP